MKLPQDLSVRFFHAPPAPQPIAASAYTKNGDIRVRPNDNKHLSHESWHVAQQTQNQISVTTPSRQ